MKKLVNFLIRFILLPLMLCELTYCVMFDEAPDFTNWVMVRFD